MFNKLSKQRLLKLIDEIDMVWTNIEDSWTCIGLIIFSGLIICAIGYAFWYSVALFVFDADYRVMLIIGTVIMMIASNVKPILGWLRSRLQPSAGTT